ncbi:hypothetical protein BGW41_002338 [Actinomortierella wolfii]|nr:hypothetical protein BGW41_002338 [Actinomortierella wolfii]
MRLLLLSAIVGSMAMVTALSQDIDASKQQQKSLPELYQDHQETRQSTSAISGVDNAKQHADWHGSQKLSLDTAKSGSLVKKLAKVGTPISIAEDDKDEQRILQQQYKDQEELLRSAFNPLVRLEEQIDIPQVAGVPPPLETHLNLKGHRKSQKQLRQEYLVRLEQQRSKSAGTLYVELDDEGAPLATSQQPRPGPRGSIRLSREVLPWEVEGFGDDDGDGDEADMEGGAMENQEAELHDSFSLIDSDENNFENTLKCMRKMDMSFEEKTIQDARIRTMDNDDGSAIADFDEDFIRLEESTIDNARQEKLQGEGEREGQQPQQEQQSEQQQQPEKQQSEQQQMPISGDITLEGRSKDDKDVKAEDPQVEGSTEEIVRDPTSSPESSHESMHRSHYEHRRDLAQQQGQARFELTDGNIGEFMQDDLRRHQKKRPSKQRQKNEIDLMIQEAQLDGVQTQKKPSGVGRLELDDITGYENVDDDSDDDNDNNDVEEDEICELADDPQWVREHGSQNPVHYYQRIGQPSKASSLPKGAMRIEEQDIDDDGTIIPDEESRDPYSKIVYPFKPGDGTSALAYVAYNHKGDRIMDFSMVGWNEGNTPLPDPSQIPVLEKLSPRPGAESDNDTGDDSQRIQEAIDRVTAQVAGEVTAETMIPIGALALEKGIYRISKPLTIQGSGILFRGDPQGGTRIVCRWQPNDHHYAMEVQGLEEDEMLDDSRVPLIASYTPVGSFALQLDPVYLADADYKVGDAVVVTRVGNKKWIKDIGMDDFHTDKKGVKPWKKMKANMYRTIRALDLETGIVQLDAPLPIAISRRYGGGYITKIGVDRKIRAVGIQYFDMVFPANIGRTADDMLDKEGRGSTDYRFSHEIFSNYVIRFDNIQHAYMSHVVSAYFHNFLSTGSEAHHLTFEANVHSYLGEMLSGQSAFQLSSQLTLVRNTLSQGSFHFFVHISHVMGPNVVHRVQATNVGQADQPMNLDFAPGEVGPHMKFCSGMLYDQVVTDGAILIVNRGSMGSGQGFSGANSVIWNSRAREGILIHRAKGFQNFVIGSEAFEAHDRMPESSHGWKEHLNAEVLPGSLYLRQLADRLDRLKKGWVA